MSEKKIYNLVHIDSNPEAATQLQRIIRTYGLSSDFVIDVKNIKSVDQYLKASKTLETDLLLYKAGGTEEELELLINGADLTTIIMIAIADEGELEVSQSLIDMGFDEVVVLSKPAVLYKKLVAGLNVKNMRDNYRELREEFRVLKEQSATFLMSTDDAVAYVVDGMFTYFNDAFWQQMGYANEDDFLGVLLLDLLPSDQIDSFMAMMEKAESKEEPLLGEAYFLNKKTGESQALSLVMSRTVYEGERCIELKIPSEMSKGMSKDLVADEHSKLSYIESLPDYIGQGSWLLNVVIKDYTKIWSRYGILLYERYIKTVTAQLANQFQGIRMVRYTDGSLLLIIDNADVSSIDRIGNSVANAVRTFQYKEDEMKEAIQSDVGYTYTSLNVEVSNISKALRTIEQQSGLIPVITKAGRIEGNSATQASADSVADEGLDRGEERSAEGYQEADLIEDGEEDYESEISAEFSVLADALEQGNIRYSYAPVADFNDGEMRYLAHYHLVDDNENIISWNKGFLSTVNNGVSQRLDALIISNAIRELNETEGIESIVINLSASIILNGRFADTVFKTITSDDRFKQSLVLGVDIRVMEEHEVALIRFFEKSLKAGVNSAIYGVASEESAEQIERILKSIQYVELHSNIISRISRIRKEDERKGIELFLKKISQNGVKVLAAGVDSPTTMAAVWEYNIPLATGTMIGSPSKKLDFDFSQIII